MKRIIMLSIVIACSYTSGNAQTAFGGLCSTGGGSLPGNWGVDFNSYNLYFRTSTLPLFDTTGSFNTNTFFLGHPCNGWTAMGVSMDILHQSDSSLPCEIASAGLHIRNIDERTCTTSLGSRAQTFGIDVGVGGSNSLAEQYGGRFEVNGKFKNYGVYAVANDGNDLAFNYGGKFIAQYGDFNAGVIGMGVDNDGNATVNFGGNFTAENSLSYNVGVLGYAHGASDSTGLDIGVRGKVQGTGNNLGAVGDYAGYFDGDVLCYNLYQISDTVLKVNCTQVTNSLEFLKQLDIITFNYNNSEYGYLGFDNNTHCGVIAQQVEQVQAGFGNFVKNKLLAPEIDTTGNIFKPAIKVKMVNYIELIPIIIAGVKELSDSLSNSIINLQSQVNNLQSQLTNLQIQINGCCQPSEIIEDKDVQIIDSLHSISVVLDNIKSIVLNQNEPNPFAEQTTIKYQIPETVRDAVIYFADNAGNILRVFEIPERGTGQIIVYAQNLSSGVYYYYLVIDGVTIETKKMVCTK